jgi:hypothetical protein
MEAATIWKFLHIAFAAAASPDDQPSDELRAIAGASSVAKMNTINGLAWLAIIYVMVAKPFS